jgi:DNA-binding NarL/FixJ family response regulator
MSNKEPKVGIVSRNLFQSQLLARFLELESGVFCLVCSPFDESGQAGLSKNHLSLILWDCDGCDPDCFWDELNRFIHSRAQNRPVALLNAPDDPDIEFDAIEKGLCGVFSRHTEPGLFAKGVNVILNGESWYSRQCLARYLAAGRRSGSNPRLKFPACHNGKSKSWEKSHPVTPGPGYRLICPSARIPSRPTSATSIKNSGSTPGLRPSGQRRNISEARTASTHPASEQTLLCGFPAASIQRGSASTPVFVFSSWFLI